MNCPRCATPVREPALEDTICRTCGAIISPSPPEPPPEPRPPGPPPDLKGSRWRPAWRRRRGRARLTPAHWIAFAAIVAALAAVYLLSRR